MVAPEERFLLRRAQRRVARPHGNPAVSVSAGDKDRPSVGFQPDFGFRLDSHGQEVGAACEGAKSVDGGQGGCPHDARLSPLAFAHDRLHGQDPLQQRVRALPGSEHLAARAQQQRASVLDVTHQVELLARREHLEVNVHQAEQVIGVEADPVLEGAAHPVRQRIGQRQVNAPVDALAHAHPHRQRPDHLSKTEGRGSPRALDQQAVSNTVRIHHRDSSAG